MKFNFHVEHGGILCQIFMTILINIPLICFGMTMGWLSPNALVLQSSSSPTSQSLRDEHISWMASIPFLTGIPSVFLYWFLVDVMGRKMGLICTSLPFVICWALTLYSSEPWALITARAIAGIGSSGSFIVPPLYVKEISQDSIRGALGSVLVLAQNSGYLLAYVMSEYMSYDAVLWACFAIPLAHVLVFCFIPESPSFDISKGRLERATKTLAWLRQRSPGDKVILDEVSLLTLQEHSVKTSKTELFKSIVTNTETFKAFRMSLIVVLAQEICGMFTLVMFAGRIFETAGQAWLSPNQQIIILGFVQLGGSIVASSFVEKVGRKPLLTACAYVISTCLLILGLWFYLQSLGLAMPSWVPILTMCVAIFCDAAGLQPVPYVILSEMFKFELRGMVTTAIMGFADLANFAELKVFHSIALNMGIYSCFWIFTVISLIYSTYILLCVPETMGKTVDEIMEELKDKKDKTAKKDNTNGGTGDAERIYNVVNLNIDKSLGVTLKDLNDLGKALHKKGIVDTRNVPSDVNEIIIEDNQRRESDVNVNHCLKCKVNSENSEKHVNISSKVEQQNNETNGLRDENGKAIEFINNLEQFKARNDKEQERDNKKRKGDSTAPTDKKSIEDLVSNINECSRL